MVSYLSNQKFSVNLENSLSEISSLQCGVTQGSIFGPSRYLIYVNNIPMAVTCNLFSYVDNTCLVSQSDTVKDCVKSVHIRSYSGPHFSAFGLNRERYGASLCIQSKCGKMRARITPNMDTLYAVQDIKKQLNENFASICDWFVDNKLNIQFGKDETKSILLPSKLNIKKFSVLDIICNNIRIKQHS